MAEKDTKEISWRAAEFEFKEKGPFWYLVIGFIAATLIVIALAQKNFFFAVFVLVASIILTFFGRLKPQVFDFKISGEGIKIGENKFYNYNDLENFSILSHPNRLDEIILKKKSVINSFIKIPIDSKNALKAKNFLTGKLPEVEHKESLVDIFSDLLKL